MGKVSMRINLKTSFVTVLAVCFNVGIVTEAVSDSTLTSIDTFDLDFNELGESAELIFILDGSDPLGFFGPVSMRESGVV